MNDVIKKVLNKLNDKSYIIGGYVRDYLLGISSFDVDICTSLRPEEVARIFKSSFNQFGVVSFSIDEYNFDVASFRTEANYQRRRPQVIEFCDNLEEDLKRRDFTINTICMDSSGNLLDLLNGIDDLKNKTVRVVGDIKEKLSEDPLRILRAIRFATTLDFNLEPELSIFIKDNTDLVKALLNDRIKEELDKIFKSKNAMSGIELMRDLNVLNALNISYSSVKKVSNYLGYWAQLKTSNIPFTNKEKKSIINITEIVKYQSIDNNVLFKYDINDVLIAGEIINISDTYIKEMYNRLPIKSRNDIDISYQELKYITNCNNNEIGNIFDDLANKILSNELDNDNTKIKEYLKKK